MITLATSNAHLLMWIAVVAVFSIVIPLVPALQRSRNLWPFCLLAAAFYDWPHFTGFLIVLGIGYATVRSLNRLTSRSMRWRWACIAMISLVVVFTLGRVLHWDRLIALPGGGALSLYDVDMWLTLRFVTLFWEVGAGSVAAPTLTAFMLWAALPFTMAGPIFRYSEFPRAISVNLSLWRSAAWWMEMFRGAAKLAAGMALPALHAAVFQHWPQARMLSKGTGTFFTGPFSFYLSTAGYLTLMEVLGKPAGFKLPPSFNFPIGRENISSFWMNWNMTATYVFRDYLFYNRWGLKSYNVYFNTLLLFTLVGLWHATNAYWILWGFLHGLLFSSYLLWRKYGNRLGHIPLRGTLASRTAARVLTYVCVCAAWYLPSKILQKLGAI